MVFAPTTKDICLHNGRHLPPKFTNLMAFARQDPAWHRGFSTFNSMITPKIEGSVGFSFFPHKLLFRLRPDPDMNVMRRRSHCKLAKWSMRMPRTSTTTPAGLSLDLYSLHKDCPWIQTSTVSPSSQTQPACRTWGLASCWRKTWDTWGSFKGRSWVGGVEWVLRKGTTWVWLNSRAWYRMSVATPALPCDCHVETRLDAGCEWSR